MSLFSRADQSFLSVWWWTVDRGLLAAAIILIIFGVVLITTASPSVAQTIGAPHYHFVLRHLIFLLPAFGLLLAISMLEHRTIWRLSSLLFLVVLALMAVVLFAGYEVKGARRWLHVLGFSLQPSEFIKPLFLVVAAWLMALQKKTPAFPGYIIMIALYFIVVALLLLQPDFGMTFVLSFAWGVQIFIAGLPLRYVISLIGLAAIGIIGVYLSLDHVKNRIDRFLNPEAGDNYQVEKSLEAFQSGGFFGAGPGQGSVKKTLPDAHADFIVAVAGEEFGLLFILIVIGLFAFILLRGFAQLMKKDDIFTVLAAGGLLSMIGLQAFVHMGSALNLIPAKGMTLPFMSYGGSSLLSVCLSMGIVLALLRKKTQGGLSKASLSV